MKLNRRAVAVLYFGILAATAVWLGLKLSLVVRESKVLANNMARLPDLLLQGVDGVNFRLDPGQQPIVIVIFDSNCESCRIEVLALHEYRHLFGQVEWFMVSSESITAIRQFTQQNNLSGFDNIKFASLDAGRLLETFGSGVLPHILLYEQNGRLIAQLRGATSPQDILEYFRQKKGL